VLAAEQSLERRQSRGDVGTTQQMMLSGGAFQILAVASTAKAQLPMADSPKNGARR